MALSRRSRTLTLTLTLTLTIFLIFNNITSQILNPKSQIRNKIRAIRVIRVICDNLCSKNS